MKKIFILGMILLIVILFVVGFFVLSNLHSNQPVPVSISPTPNTTSFGTVPTDTNTGNQTSPTNTNTQTMSVAAENGGTIKTNDFKANPATTPDPNNAGHYYLAGMFTVTNQNPPYSIVYNDSDQSFNVSLWTEPLAQTRLTAEQDLMQKLGISQNDMCNLKYWVGTSDDVNPVYAAKNLGFSFCPGAVQLP